MNFKFAIVLLYLTGLALIVLSFLLTPISFGLSGLGIVFVVLGLVSRSDFSPFKLVDNRISALIWMVLSIVTGFSGYLLGLSENRNILFGVIGISLFNLVAILVTKMQEEKAKA